MILSLLISLCLTLVIELITSFVIGIRNKEDVKIVICTNILTNPVVVYLANCIRMLNNILIYNIVVLIMELIVIVVEFTIYKRYLVFNRKSPLFISVINNVVSFSIGVIISKVIF